MLVVAASLLRSLFVVFFAVLTGLQYVSPIVYLHLFACMRMTQVFFLLQVFFQCRWKCDCVVKVWWSADGTENSPQPTGHPETEHTLPLW